MRLLVDIADGMAYMHAKSICHGDLSPSNILLKVRRRKHASSVPCRVTAPPRNSFWRPDPRSTQRASCRVA